MPITWQNINGASLADASRPMEVAQRSFNGAFDGLQGILKQREELDAANWATGKLNNTNTGLNAINQYATPEEFQAAQKSGAIAQLMAANGAQVDQQALRAAVDGRMGILQQRAKTGIEYKNTMLDDQQAPTIEAARMAILNGNPAEAARLSQGLRRGSEVAQFGRTIGHENTVWDEDKKQYVRAEGTYQDGLLTTANQRKVALGNLGVAQGQLGVARRNADTNAGELKMRQVDRLENQLAKAMESDRTLNENFAGSTAGMQKVADYLQGIKDPADRRQASLVASELSTQPHMTTGVILNSLMGLQSSYLQTDSGDRADAIAAGKLAAGSPAVLLNREGVAKGKALTDERINILRAQLATFEGGTATTATATYKKQAPSVVNPIDNGVRLPAAVAAENGPSFIGADGVEYLGTDPRKETPAERKAAIQKILSIQAPMTSVILPPPLDATALKKSNADMQAKYEKQSRQKSLGVIDALTPDVVQYAGEQEVLANNAKVTQLRKGIAATESRAVQKQRERFDSIIEDEKNRPQREEQKKLQREAARRVRKDILDNYMDVR